MRRRSTPRSNSVNRDSVLYAIYPRMAFALARRPLILVEAEEQETPSTLLKRRYQDGLRAASHCYYRLHFNTTENLMPSNHPS